ncbi:hypothetical protein AVEN_221475-1 [Araneus ventricosus]|uniref:Uncharacterized protein n=1 Tax=Araneus ventricosus TaxID=182803 RepID=A0A4Y2U1Q2_ARAVE|nr:hypothetical protein AVEN_221475-1 [Araneus ventricosus]
MPRELFYVVFGGLKALMRLEPELHESLLLPNKPRYRSHFLTHSHWFWQGSDRQPVGRGAAPAKGSSKKFQLLDRFPLVRSHGRESQQRPERFMSDHGPEVQEEQAGREN